MGTSRRSSGSPTSSPRPSSSKRPSPKRTLSARAGPSSKPSHTRREYEDSEDVLLGFVPCATTSRFFPPVNPSELLLDPTFTIFYEDFIAAMLDLYYAKPILIQEYVRSDPWKVLVAVCLLNKTAGKKSIPMFFELMDAYPTPQALAQAPFSQLFELLKDLGLGTSRAKRLVAISQAFLADPPNPETPRPSRGHTTALFMTPSGSVVVKKVPYPSTPVSHIPGCGPYALDSYRMFCGSADAGDDGWKAVRPTDKELIKHMQWRWAVEAYRRWDPVYGRGEPIDLQYVRELTASLTLGSCSVAPSSTPLEICSSQVCGTGCE